MNLQPRRSSPRALLAQAMEEFLEVNPGWSGGVAPEREPSIWRMELPNESYMAPRAAFWFVSNERRP